MSKVLDAYEAYEKKILNQCLGEVNESTEELRSKMIESETPRCDCPGCTPR